MKIQIQVYTLDRPQDELDAEYGWFIYDLERVGQVLNWCYMGENQYIEPFEGITILPNEKAAGRNFEDAVFPYMEGDI